MTADTAVVLHQVEPVERPHIPGNIALATELVRVRNLQHGIPVDRRIVRRRGRVVGGGHGSEVELLAGLGINLRRIDETIAAHPQRILGLRQIRHHVAALVVGDHAAREPGAEIVGFRDDPYAGLGAVGSAHHAADVVIVDGDRRLGASLHRRQQRCETDCGDRAQVESFRMHIRLLCFLPVASGPAPRSQLHTPRVRAADCHAIGRQSMDIRQISLAAFRPAIPAAGSPRGRAGSARIQGGPASERNSTAIPPRSSLRT